MASHSSIRKILIIDDDADFRNLLLAFLKKSFEDVEIEEYDPVARGIPDDDFNWAQYDVLLLDYYLCIQGVTGLDILQSNRKNLPFPATIMLTGAGSEEVAVRALKGGVYDYIRKEKLDKKHLHSSILAAFEKLQKDRERFNERTNQSKAYNKAMFYQKLELKPGDPEYVKRVLLLIRLDNHKSIDQVAGMIIRDNIVRYMAKQSFEVFELGECNPNITRISDTSVALLIDDPGSNKTLEFNINGLCKHLRKHPYRFEGSKYRFKVSIGVVVLGGDDRKARELLKQARMACDTAAKQEENSYHIYEDSAAGHGTIDSIPANDIKPEQEKPARPAATKTDPEPQPAQEKTRTRTRPDKVKPEPVQTPSPELPASPAAAEKPAPKQTPAEEPPPPKQDLPELPLPTATEDISPAADAPADDEIELVESELNEEGLKLKKAFDENRVVETFQPLISLTEISNENEFQYVSLEAVNTDGSNIKFAEIQPETRTPLFQKYTDRWILRETLGRLVNNEQNKNTFVIRISAASLADSTLFNWLRRLLSGLDARNPGKYVALEITAADFFAVQKQATALMAYLSKSHGFNFILGEISEEDDIKTLSSKAKFNLFKMKHEVVVKLNETPADDTPDSKSILDLLKSKGANIIADDVEDATTLTNVITMGIDFAMGYFIGEPTVHLEEITNIESFEII